MAILDEDANRCARLAQAGASDPNVESVHVVADGDALITLVERGDAQVALVSTRSSKVDGLTLVRLVAPRVPVIVFVEAAEAECVLDALALGAAGYLDPNDARLFAPSGGLGAYVIDLVATEPQAPTATRCPGVSLLPVAAGGAAGLTRLLRASGTPDREGLYVLLDAPACLVEPMARRLHRSTPWRVLAAREGDHVPTGHALLATLADGLVPSPRAGRARLARVAPWRRLADAIVEIGGSERIVPEPEGRLSWRAA